jgi:endosialidase-like protein
MKPKNLVIILTMVLALVSGLTVQAITPTPDGGYPGGNTAEGTGALLFHSSGTYDTAIGWESLRGTSSASFNTGVGAGTLALNNADRNTATGAGALLLNGDGSSNTANGALSMVFNATGANNSALGDSALESNTSGNCNTAVGHEALVSNNVGHDNTGVGCSALGGNTSGNNNTAIGSGAGANLTSGDNNIYIGSAGEANESNTIHLGNDSSAATFLGGISGINVIGVPVLVSITGQLGITVSSERFKQDVASMGDSSEALFDLKPVTFHYKKQLDPQGIRQFGLVAEQVAKVNPDLVVRDKQGKIMTVRYDAVNAMLLNEFLKEHRKAEEMRKTVGALTAQLQEQAAQIQKVSAQLELNKSAPELVAHTR